LREELTLASRQPRCLPVAGFA